VIVGTGFPVEIHVILPFPFSKSITVAFVPSSVLGYTLIEKKTSSYHLKQAS